MKKNTISDESKGKLGFLLFLFFFSLSPYFLISGDNRVLTFLNYIPQKFNLSVFFGVFLWILILLDYPNKNPINRITKLSIYLLLFFYLCVAGSIFWGLHVFAYDPYRELLYNIMGITSWTGIAVAGPYFINSQKRIKQTINVIIVFILFTFLLGIIEFILGGKRIGGPYSDANYFGRLIIVLFSVLIPLFAARKKVLEKKNICFIIIFIIGFLLLILTGSRSSFLGLVLFLTIILIMNKKYIQLIIGSIIIVPVFYLYASYIIQTRQSGVTKGANVLIGSLLDLSNSTRLALDIAAFNMWIDNFFLGVGYRNFQTYLPIYDIEGIPYMTYVSAVHNWILGLLAENGILGFLLFFLSLAFPIKKLFDQRKIHSGYKRIVSETGILIIMTFMIHGLFFPPFGQEFIYVYFYSFVLAILNQLENDTEKPAIES